MPKKLTPTTATAVAIGVVKNKFLKKILYFLEHFIYKNSNAIVPLSKDMKKSILSRYPKLIYKPIEVIENICEIERFQKNYSNEKIIKKWDNVYGKVLRDLNNFIRV